MSVLSAFIGGIERINSILLRVCRQIAIVSMALMVVIMLLQVFSVTS